MYHFLFSCICICHEVFWGKSDCLQFCLAICLTIPSCTQPPLAISAIGKNLGAKTFLECSFSSGHLKATWEEARDFQDGLAASTSQATWALGAVKQMALQPRTGPCIHASVLNRESPGQKQSTKEPGSAGYSRFTALEHTVKRQRCTDHWAGSHTVV